MQLSPKILFEDLFPPEVTLKERSIKPEGQLFCDNRAWNAASVTGVLLGA